MPIFICNNHKCMIEINSDNRKITVNLKYRGANKCIIPKIKDIKEGVYGDCTIQKVKD